MKRLLIVGCGRSGTQYTAHVLSRAGYRFGHERPEQNGSIDWRGVVRSTDGYDVVWHQVRHPLLVIASCHTIMAKSWRYVYKNEPRIEPRHSILKRCMGYWLYWNERASQMASRTYRVEDMKMVLPDLIEALGEPHAKANPNSWLKQQSPAANTKRALRVPTNTHSREHKDSYVSVDVSDLFTEDYHLASRIWALASEYGYEDFSAISP